MKKKTTRIKPIHNKNNNNNNNNNIDNDDDDDDLLQSIQQSEAFIHNIHTINLL